MDKQQFVDKTVEVLKPFETDNLMQTIQTLTLQKIFGNPIILAIIFLVLFFGIYKRSKAILLSLFALIGLIVIVKFAMPSPGQELDLHSLLPFIGGGLVIGAVIIYFALVKSD